jgi:hypothetical protein
MSVVGQTRKSTRVTLTSAFPPLATKLRTSLLVRFVPNSEVVASFDHLVGTSEQREWDREAKCPSGLEVDGHLDFRDLLHR